MKRILIKILSIINIVLALVFGIGAYYFIPQYEEIFTGFGAELPWATRALLNTYQFLILLVVIPIMGYIFSNRKDQTGSYAMLSISVALLVFFYFLLPVIIVALYLPVFQFGENIQL